MLVVTQKLTKTIIIKIVNIYILKNVSKALIVFEITTVLHKMDHPVHRIIESSI